MLCKTAGFAKYPNFIYEKKKEEKSILRHRPKFKSERKQCASS